jgi:membrane protease subunit HflK
MAWNQPGDDKRRPAARSAPDSASLDDMLHRWQERMQQLWRPGSGRAKAALALVLIGAAIWLASGYYQIGAAERGVVQSFGRYVSTEHPGSGWHWPWPIQTMTKLNVGTVEAVDSHALMLTDDQSLINLSWSVQYTVSDPQRFLFQLRDPQGTLRQTSETVIRELTAADALHALLDGDARSRLAAEARGRIQQVLDRYDSGVTVRSVSLTDVELPDPVVAAEHDAQHAADERQRALSDAQTYANGVELKARAAAQQQTSEAQVYATQTLAQAQGDVERFNQQAAAFAAAPQVTRDRLYIQTVNDILSHSRKIFVDAKSGNGTMLYLPLDQLAQAVRRTAPAASAPSAGAEAGADNTPSDRDNEDDRSRTRGGDR